MFCNKFLVCDNALSLPNFGTSDHCALSFNMFLDAQSFSPSPSKNAEYCWDFSHADFDAFGQWLCSLDWQNLFNNTDSVDTMWEIFLSKIKSGLESFVPKRTRKISYVRGKITPCAHFTSVRKEKKVMARKVFKRSLILLLSTQ